MAELMFCKICLMQDVKMFKYDKCCLKEYYEEIVNTVLVNYSNNLSQWICFECATMLTKFHNFRLKCYRSLKCLTELLEKGPLTSKYIDNQLYKQRRSLRSPLGFVSASNNRVKTYTFQYNYTQLPDSVSCNFKNCTKENVFGHNNELCTKGKTTVTLERACTDKRKETNIIEQGYRNENNTAINFNHDVISADDYNMTSEIDQGDVEVTEPCDTTKSNIVHEETNNKQIEQESKTKNKNAEMNKFKRSIKKKFLNPSNWKKFSLSEENADKEFKAKALHQKYLKANFKCSNCFRGFSQEEMLKRHMKIKHCKSLGQFECRFCHMRVKWKSRLQKHLKEHYTRYKCLRCELSFSVEETAFKHDEFHNGVMRTCPHCAEEFRHSSSFYTHVRKHRSKHVCTTCGVSFLSEFGLYMHKKVKHILTNPNSKIDENRYCDVCDIKFETQRAYEEHLAQSAMHTIVTGENESLPQPLKWRYTQRRAPRKYTSCAICSQNFSTYVAYSKHHIVEHPNVPLGASPYKQNIRKICEICGASVAPVSLASHINTHTREKRHICNICGTQLSSKSGLNRHRLTHSREKLNKCSLCDKRFAQTTNMKLHYRTVHNNTLEPCVTK